MQEQSSIYLQRVLGAIAALTSTTSGTATPSLLLVVTVPSYSKEIPHLPQIRISAPCIRIYMKCSTGHRESWFAPRCYFCSVGTVTSRSTADAQRPPARLSGCLVSHSWSVVSVGAAPVSETLASRNNLFQFVFVLLHPFKKIVPINPGAF